jgi:D-tyrosyl-tRNA(Tyr) deacylase
VSSASKIVKLKLFPDPSDSSGNRWKQSLLDIPDSGVLAVSQFTLYADVSKGNKPDFHRAMNGSEAKLLFDEFVREVGKALGSTERVRGSVPFCNHHLSFYVVCQQVGAFGEYMQVSLENDGPVTMVLDTSE